jgi:hypothetical protein
MKYHEKKRKKAGKQSAPKAQADMNLDFFEDEEITPLNKNSSSSMQVKRQFNKCSLIGGILTLLFAVGNLGTIEIIIIIIYILIGIGLISYSLWNSQLRYVDDWKKLIEGEIQKENSLSSAFIQNTCKNKIINGVFETLPFNTILKLIKNSDPNTLAQIWHLNPKSISKMITNTKINDEAYLTQLSKLCKIIFPQKFDSINTEINWNAKIRNITKEINSLKHDIDDRVNYIENQIPNKKELDIIRSSVGKKGVVWCHLGHIVELYLDHSIINIEEKVIQTYVGSGGTDESPFEYEHIDVITYNHDNIDILPDNLCNLSHLHLISFKGNEIKNVNSFIEKFLSTRKKSEWKVDEFSLINKKLMESVHLQGNLYILDNDSGKIKDEKKYDLSQKIYDLNHEKDVLLEDYSKKIIACFVI